MGHLVAVNERGSLIGESHQNARYTDGEVEMVHVLRESGYGYKRISRKLEMPIRTVRGICNFARRGQYPAKWKEIKE